MNKLERLKNALLMGGNINLQQQELHNSIKDLTNEELQVLLLKSNEALKQKDDIIDELMNENEDRPKKQRKTKNIDIYDAINFYKFMKTIDAKNLFNNETDTFIDPTFYSYDPFNTAFDKLKDKKLFFDYQQKFIENWSLSQQELVILYYGVGSGKTTIAVNCAEQFQAINNDASVYILTPASLVLGTIKECYERGIDPTRKNEKGDFIYYFISYQQLLLSNFDFKDNSLLIIDEAHNLRNIQAKEISEKENARKYVKTGNYSLVGNVLAQRLIHTSSKFLRTIFMTGTLFVNKPEDIEALMAIGYKKQPMLDIDKIQYDSIINSDREFKIYYEGLISFFRLKEDDPRFPKKIFEFVNIKSEDVEIYTGLQQRKEDAYFKKTRNMGISKKFKWIVDFLTKHKNDRTLIYSQFLTGKIKPLYETLEKLGYKVGIISGELSQPEKLNIVRQYNTGEINVLIFTLSIKEGISFKLTNNIIVIEPYWNYAIMEQVLARGIRANSHPDGQKSNIKLYFLVATNPNLMDENLESVRMWFKKANEIMNNDIKKFIYPVKIEKSDAGDVKVKQKGILSSNYGSRDIDLFNRMFNKQENINIFEQRLLSLPRFEEVNNIENNEFIDLYKRKLFIFENDNNRKPTNKEEIILKKTLYKELYLKKIAEIDKRIVRFNQDTRYKENRNPNLEEKLNDKDYGNKGNIIKNMVDNNKSIEDMLNTLGVDKKEITQFQANFTPIREVDLLIKHSGIQDDKREKILILEPTAGIGGVIGQLLLQPNKENLNIDAVEFHNGFYQIGKAIYDEIKNVKFYNADFWIYQNKYEYDYILGNPPFNLKHQILEEVKFSRKKGQPPPDPPSIFRKVDKTLFDIHFVSKAYNMLNEGGILSMIISDRYLRDKTIPVFEVFRQYMKHLDTLKCYKYVDISTFKSDKGVSKTMETKFPMINIVLKKAKDFNINLDDPKIVDKRITQNMDEEAGDSLIKDMKKEIKLSKPKKPILLKTGKGLNSWISFVKQYANDNNISYKDALKDGNMKTQYYNNK